MEELTRREVFWQQYVDVSSYDELKVAISQGKWARGPWSAGYVYRDFFNSINMNCTSDADIELQLLVQ